MSYKFPYLGCGRREDFLRAERDGFSILIKSIYDEDTYNKSTIFSFQFPDDHICIYYSRKIETIMKG